MRLETLTEKQLREYKNKLIAIGNDNFMAHEIKAEAFKEYLRVHEEIERRGEEGWQE